MPGDAASVAQAAVARAMSTTPRLRELVIPLKLCHPERARPLLARESKDPYSEDHRRDRGASTRAGKIGPHSLSMTRNGHGVMYEPTQTALPPPPRLPRSGRLEASPASRSASGPGGHCP